MKEIIKVKSGKDILRLADDDKKTPRQVFGRFLYEGEIGILFGDSNTGKTILANEIAFFAAGGGHEWKDMTSPNIPTMYVDMEMTQKQFIQRYHNAGDYIPDNYMRVEVDSFAGDEKVFTALRTKIVQMQALGKDAPKLIIIDNITNGFVSIFSASQMRGLIGDLKTLRDKFGLTVLLIAHCPKRRPNTPLTQDSLGGSSVIIKLADSAFAIGNTIHGDDIKYIKQVKVRADEKMEDVLTVQLTDEPYLSFKPIGYEWEQFCLEKCYSIDLTSLITPEQEIKLANLLPDTSKAYWEIAAEVGLTMTQVIQYSIKSGLRC